MRPKKVLTTSILAFMVFFLSYHIQAEPIKITLEGRVVNGTLENKPVAGQEVELHVYKGNQELRDAIQKTKTDPDGYFRFSQLDSELKLTYSTLARYKNVEYYGPILENLDKDSIKDYQIVVYEATSEDPGIIESMHHYIIDAHDKSLMINEIVLLKNDSKKSFIGDFQISEDRRRV
ncbi:MAG: hypothetical protein ACE5GI_08205, partial [Candidatus Aminicenantales bacterium]